MKKINYTLDLTNCKTFGEIIIAVQTDLNARKQLVQPKKPWYKRIFS